MVVNTLRESLEPLRSMPCMRHPGWPNRACETIRPEPAYGMIQSWSSRTVFSRLHALQFCSATISLRQSTPSLAFRTLRSYQKVFSEFRGDYLKKPFSKLPRT